MQKSTSFDFNQSYFNAGRGHNFWSWKQLGCLHLKVNAWLGFGVAFGCSCYMWKSHANPTTISLWTFSNHGTQEIHCWWDIVLRVIIEYTSSKGILGPRNLVRWFHPNLVVKTFTFIFSHFVFPITSKPYT
jgi:hypothetical protein